MQLHVWYRETILEKKKIKEKKSVKRENKQKNIVRNEMQKLGY